MGLFIRDPEVAALAEELRRATRAKTKTEAVRRALQAQLDEVKAARPMRQRLERAKALADRMGANDPGFGMKAFTDSMWGDD